MTDIILPRLYPGTETKFDSNGLGTLAEAQSCTVTEQRNGRYELAMSYPINGRLYDQIRQRSIITAQPAPGKPPQPFRVAAISTPMRGMATITARHISYDLNGIPVKPFTAPNAGAALAYLRNNALVPALYQYWTDIESTADLATPAPLPARLILGGMRGSVLDVYGGELEWDGYTVRLWRHRGQNRGVEIRYGKNLTDLRQEANNANCYTGACPYWLGQDGTLVTVPGYIISAPGKFDHDNIMQLDATAEFADQPTPEELAAWAKRYIDANKISTPAVSLDVSFAPLAQLSGTGSELMPLETIELCDTVTVIFPDLGVDTTAQVVSVDYDALRGRYRNITLGSIRPNIADKIVGQNQQTEQQLSDLGDKNYQAIKNATEQITGQQGGYLMIGLNDQRQPYELLIMDDPDKTRAKNVWRWNLGGLGHSSNGYAGPYGTAITQDGRIVADYIQAGALNSPNVTVGGFELDDRAIKNGMQSWDDRDHDGIYLGARDGIALGAGRFRVSAQGDLQAETGRFAGAVYAANIATDAQIPGAGYISDSQVGRGQITGGYGGSIRGGTITTANTSGGINMSLGYADFSDDVFKGADFAAYMGCSYLTVGQQIIYRNSYLNMRSLQVTTPNGPKTIQFLGNVY